MSPAPLAGMRVLDCTHVMAGSFCSMLLADLGADVIKIESPKGDVTRTTLGKFRGYDYVNRNKRAIAVDLANPEGAAALRRLAETADIWVENYRPGVLEKFGLGYDDLSKLNPALIYCTISGFGLTGPYRDRGGFDLVTQAMSGLMSFTGELGSDVPVPAGVPISDLNAGTFAALGILAAWAHRQKTGRGQRVETSLLESVMSYAVWESGLYLANGEIAKPLGARHRLASPYEAYRARDGHLVIAAATDSLWEKLCVVLGDAALAKDPQFSHRLLRMKNRTALSERIEALLSNADTAEWVDRLLAAGIPCGPINDIGQALNDPQVQARGMVIEVGDQRFLGPPIKFSETPASVGRGPAELGEHSLEVLAEAGFAQHEIDRLVSSGALVAGKARSAR